jgi:hypothetical protein
MLLLKVSGSILCGANFNFLFYFKKSNDKTHAISVEKMDIWGSNTRPNTSNMKYFCSLLP